MPGAWHFGQQMRISFELSTGVATIGLAGYRLVGESLRGTSREGRFLRNVEENTLVIVDSYPVFAEDGAARTAPQTAQQVYVGDACSHGRRLSAFHTTHVLAIPVPVIVDVAAIKSFRDPTHGIVRGHDCGHASVPSSTSTAPCRLSRAATV